MKNWIKEIDSPTERKWEEFYRNRFQHDRRVRTTHGVNCTGSCSWEVFVKDGIVTWELQATDYPRLEEGLPPYEPRGCQRGISYSWYLYSPIRVKYPYGRGALIDLWREAKAVHPDPVEAWDILVSDPEKRSAIQQARGKGGFRRMRWPEALEIIAASVIYTIKKYGPDRILGFSPIPAMSQISYAAGSRFLSLLGGIVMSFYDWYCDLPPASPEVWGEQTQEQALEHTHEVIYRPDAPQGKLDLIVDLNFRMDTSALYSDIILPAATWYEKNDLNTTDMHSFINPMQAAVPPAWESKSDWEIFKEIAKKVSELAKIHLSEPVKDVVMLPLQHDTADELAQPEIKDWKLEEIDPILGKTMPKFRVTEQSTNRSQYPACHRNY